MKRLLRLEWDAIAGIIAAVTALVLHLLHIVESDVLLMIAVVLIAVLFARDIRRERTLEHIEKLASDSGTRLETLSSSLRPPDAILVGPAELRATSEEFSRRAQGDDVVPRLFAHVQATTPLRYAAETGYRQPKS